MKEFEKKTINEWCDRHNIIMLDPDGFDRTDPELFERKFTEQEFMAGLYRSTIRMKELMK